MIDPRIAMKLFTTAVVSNITPEQVEKAKALASKGLKKLDAMIQDTPVDTSISAVDHDFLNMIINALIETNQLVYKDGAFYQKDTNRKVLEAVLVRPTK